MNTAQCMMARAALGWTIQQLAEVAGLDYATIRRFEGGHNVHARSRGKIESALTGGGAEFFRRSGRVGVTVPDKILSSRPDPVVAKPLTAVPHGPSLVQAHRAKA